MAAFKDLSTDLRPHGANELSMAQMIMINAKVPLMGRFLADQINVRDAQRRFLVHASYVRRRLEFVQANSAGYKFISIEQQELAPCLNPSSSAI